ncbi:MBL fold metallo-hydrolase [Rothia kristinae]|uniref:MBL fold metallo-hydrolase n=1 Tax=Rothia kristinae TaxID=37923 RepID=A0A7T3FAE9_9MICC|nr:MBL fold metallo-hydrolase [Rothia kristinae]MED6047239.1 MBL fold metallo-hydrolase [Rothia kristinae]QPT54156.1 MBL fold metallo-hydrolase [Rothia kristinae]TDP54699.1 glyoxylase-like metal-dependent hydrolase (beta-lactamase superfamily II) [Kocuria sp. AG109]SQC30086.1 Probable polyketide biosynthesis zinc-dependent hydrolase pksB [Rothia kristinae]
MDVTPSSPDPGHDAVGPGGPQPGGTAAPGWVRTSGHTACLRAPNPGPMTLEGTNTYVVGDLPRDWPGDGSRPGVIVVDPGAEDPEHLRRLTERTRVELILLTHRHADHAAGAPALHAMTGAPVRAAEPSLCRKGPPLEDGEVVGAAEQELLVLGTPGHTADSVCLRLDADSVMFTGDTVLGRGSTMLDYPDGALEPYIDSLRDLLEQREHTVLPGHGAPGGDLHARCEALLEHRLDRFEALQELLRETDDDIGPSASALARRIYPGVPDAARAAAVKTLKAQLAHLVELGAIAGFSE